MRVFSYFIIEVDKSVIVTMFKHLSFLYLIRYICFVILPLIFRLFLVNLVITITQFSALVLKHFFKFLL